MHYDVTIMLIDPNYTRAVWVLVVVLVALGVIELVRTFIDLVRNTQGPRKRFSAREKHQDWLASATTVEHPAVKEPGVPGVPLSQLSCRMKAVKRDILTNLHQLLPQE